MNQKREIYGWAMYDFANSAFATSVLGVVYQVYFTSEVAARASLFGHPIKGISLWGLCIAAAMLVVLLTAPVLGAIADFSGQKKKFLFAYWLTSCLFTGLLFFVTPGSYWLGMGLFFVALVGFSGGNAFYNAFLPEIAEPARLGRVSGLGQALGYVGGGLCLVLNLAIVQRPDWFGIPDRDELPVRCSLAVVALWFAVFSIPTFLFVKERPAKTTPVKGQSNLRLGYRRVMHTLRNIRRYPELARFLVAFLLFMEGVETVIVMAAAMGAEVLGLSKQELIQVYLLVQAVGVPGALFFGWLADRIGNRNAILWTLMVWCAVILLSYFVKTPRDYWVMGFLVGTVVGGVQACSRSLVALMTPEEHHAEIFGFFAMAGKAASAFGPLFMALITQWFDVRTGLLSMIVFIGLGLLLTLTVNEQKGYAEAQSNQLASTTA